MILSDIENHQRMVNELSDRVANLEALCDSTESEFTTSLDDVHSRYKAILYKARVSSG